jgi:hypothetical protein
MKPWQFCQITPSCNKAAAVDIHFRGLFWKILINIATFNQKQRDCIATSYTNVIHTHINDQKSEKKRGTRKKKEEENVFLFWFCVAF